MKENVEAKFDALQTSKNMEALNTIEDRSNASTKMNLKFQDPVNQGCLALLTVRVCVGKAIA